MEKNASLKKHIRYSVLIKPNFKTKSDHFEKSYNAENWKKRGAFRIFGKNQK